MFYAQTFDHVITFEYLKTEKLDYLKNKMSFPSEIKNIFPCFASAHFQTYQTNQQKRSGRNL